MKTLKDLENMKQLAYNQYQLADATYKKELFEQVSELIGKAKELIDKSSDMLGKTIHISSLGRMKDNLSDVIEALDALRSEAIDTITYNS